MKSRRNPVGPGAGGIFSEPCPSGRRLRAAFALLAVQEGGRRTNEAVHEHCNVDPGAHRTAPKLCRAGLTCSQIAAEIGVTRNAVIGKIHRLGLSPERPEAAPALMPSATPAPAILDAAPTLAPRSCRRPAADGRDQRRSRRGGRERAASPAARAGAGKMPLAARRAGRRGFCLLRQRRRQRLFLLRRPRAHGLPHAGAAARLALVLVRRRDSPNSRHRRGCSPSQWRSKALRSCRAWRRSGPAVRRRRSGSSIRGRRGWRRRAGAPGSS